MEATTEELKGRNEGDMVESEKRFLLADDLEKFTLPEDLKDFFPEGHRNKFHAWIDVYLDIVKQRKDKYYDKVKTLALIESVDKMTSNFTQLLERARQCKNALTSKDFTYTGIMDDFIHTTEEFNKELDITIKSLLDNYDQFVKKHLETVTSDSGLIMRKDDVTMDLQECFFLKHITNDYYQIEKEAQRVKDNRTRRLSFRVTKTMKDAMHSTTEGIKKLPQMFRTSSGKTLESEPSKQEMENHKEPEPEKQMIQKEDKAVGKDEVENFYETVDTEQKYEQA